MLIERDQHVGLELRHCDVLGVKSFGPPELGEQSWLTVVSPEDPDGTELSLEPDEHPATPPFKQALVEDGIPFTSFATHAIARGGRATRVRARTSAARRRVRGRYPSTPSREIARNALRWWIWPHDYVGSSLMGEGCTRARPRRRSRSNPISAP